MEIVLTSEAITLLTKKGGSATLAVEIIEGRPG